MSSTDEKMLHRKASDDPSETRNIENVDLESADVDEATEKALTRKLDYRIVPMCMWIYLMNFMDRIIIGNTRLAGIQEDLNLQDGDFQLAVSILFITYCLFEAPSNMIIKRFQPARYIAGLTILWGLVATFTAFVQNLEQLIACRLLLGLFEAGFFPGIILYLTMFYSKKHIALRVGYFFTTSAVAGACGGLIAYAITFMDGAAGWRAWRWMILLNGIPTVLTGILIPFVLPNSPETAKFLTEDDRRNMLILRKSQLGNTKSGQNLQKSDVMAGVKDWKTYAFGILQFCNNAMLYSFSVFLPTIIDQIDGGWSTAEAQALTIPVYALGAITYLIVARLSDMTQQRGVFSGAGALTSILGYCLLIANAGAPVSFAGTFFVAMGCWAANGMPVAWLTTNNPRYGKRAYSSGIQLSMGNAAGVAAPFLFADRFGPTYRPGYGALIGMLALAVALNATLSLWYRQQNRKRANGEENWKLEGKTEEELLELGEENPRFKYIA